MSFFSFISQIFEPAAKLIDDIHTSSEEKLQLKNKLTMIQNEMHSKVIEYEAQLLKSKTDIITAEASSEHWITSAWRPITALMLVFMVFNNYILYPYLSMFIDNAPKVDLPDHLWDLIKICLGGYIASRGAEKGVREWKKSGALKDI
jgi:hypothetical protein